MSGEFLGKTVIAYVGVKQFTGRQLQGLLLVEYDSSDDTYVAVSFPQNEKFTQFFHSLGKGQFESESPINVGVVLRIPGFRKYPYTERPNYSFQFVLVGEDPSPLLEIATANAIPIPQPIEVVEEDNPNEDANADIPQWQKEGFSSKEEWKKFHKQQG